MELKSLHLYMNKLKIDDCNSRIRSLVFILHGYRLLSSSFLSVFSSPEMNFPSSSMDRVTEIDLNVDISHGDFRQNEIGYILPDLNGFEEAEALSIDLNDIEGEHIPYQTSKRKYLSNAQRRAIYDMLLQKSIDGKLPKGTTNSVASIFSVGIRLVQRVWKQWKNDGLHADVSHKRTKNCGRKRIQIDWNRFREIPLQQRTTLSSLAYAMDMKRTTMFRRLQSGAIRRHSNAIKPLLKEENKRSRLKFCISMLEESSIPHDPTFKEMYNIVHIDEKWFQMTKKNQNYYLLPDEEDPLRTCKSKNFIGKVMFLVALARPRFDVERNEIFSGKIGVFPLVTQMPAKRNSVNRAAGTLETKPINSITRDVIRSYLIGKVLPAIKEKWPRVDCRDPIFIQQDNARTHIDQNDEEFCQAASQGGFNIRLMCQPANSPDMNVLDLGFFSAIQALQYKESPTTVDELVHDVVKSYEDFPSWKSNRIFLTLQQCMIETMKIQGSNKYRIPHMKKAVLERESQLPTQLKCESELVQEVLNHLNRTT
ncbi:uncharacterized protein [Euphorbia lathyris]|uniref:uncharacterized protein n=1 Tax=Euphorbia lathyris TaxID=212925 RepID=UPI0033131153